MNVVTVGPLSVGSLVWQGRANPVLTIACKATFSLRQGESPLSPDQQPIHPTDVYLEDDPTRSVRAPGDLVPFKSAADVILVGYAYAPRTEPARSLVVRLLVGDIDKAFEVVSDRAWTLEGALREGPRFSRLPLRYERAGGGADTANPIGVSPDAAPDLNGLVPMPNFQPLGFTPSARGEIIPPVGFGPLAGTWPGRRERLGRLAAPPERWDQAPLPADLDPRYFNCAPRDQQIDRLREDERLVLENLHAQHPRLVTNLPGVRPRTFADRGEGLQEIAMTADTLWIDTGAAICTLTWRGYVENPPQAGSVVVAMDGPGMPLPWAEVQAAARGGERPRTGEIRTVAKKPVADPLRETHSETSAVAALPAWLQGRQEAPPPRSAPAEARRDTGGLPFVMANRAPDSVAAFTATAPPTTGDAAPAWLQGRAAAPPAQPSPLMASGAWPFGASAAAAPPPVTPPAVAPPPVVPAAVQPPPVVQSAVPPSAPQGSASPWASASAITPSPLAVGASIGVIAARGPGGGAPGNATAASDAAADPQTRTPPPSRPLPAAIPTSERAPRSTPRDLFDLLWYDEAQVPRIRTWWEELVTDLDFEPTDPRRDIGVEDPEKARGRHNVFGIMSDGVVLEPASISRVIAGAVNDKGRFTPPLTLMGGELRFPFDEVETLRATIVAMTPFLGSDKRLKETTDTMSELLKTPYLQGSTGVVEKLTRDLRDQFRESNRALPASYLDSHVERLLLEQRRYAIRKVFGGEFIRALLSTPGTDGGTAIPVYLPKSLDQTLPMMIVMKVRLIAEAHLQQDPYDASAYALRAVALGRSFQLEPSRGRGGVDSDR